MFKPCEETAGRCGVLNATVPFSQLVSPGGGGPVLMTGQPYSVSVTLEMPESPANRGAGMFLTCLQMKSGSGAVAREECRAAMLQYRSELLRVIETFAFVPALITGGNQQQQQQKPLVISVVATATAVAATAAIETAVIKGAATARDVAAV